MAQVAVGGMGTVTQQLAATATAAGAVIETGRQVLQLGKRSVASLSNNACFNPV